MQGVGSFKSVGKALLGVLAGAALILLVAVVIPGNAAEGDGGKPINPDDFIVELEMEEPEPDNPEKPDCEQRADGMYCTNSFSFASEGKAKGTVKYQRTSPVLSGAMEMDYNQWMKSKTVMKVDPDGGQDQQPVPVESSGNGEQNGTWCMDFSNDPDNEGGSKMCGSINGKFSQSLVTGTTRVRWEGKFTVEALGISGRFADVAGKGSWEEVHEFDMLGGGPGGGDRGGPPPDDQEPAGVAAIAASVSASEGSAMDLKLRKSKKPIAFISGLPSKLSKKDKRSAVVAAKPKSKCSLKAKRGKRTKSFGKAKANKNARAEFKGAVVKKLKSGKWKLRATCKLKGKKAKAKKTLRIS